MQTYHTLKVSHTAFLLKSYKVVIDYFRKDYRVEIVKTKYEFGTGRDRLVPLIHINAGR